MSPSRHYVNESIIIDVNYVTIIPIQLQICTCPQVSEEFFTPFFSPRWTSLEGDWRVFIDLPYGGDKGRIRRERNTSVGSMPRKS